MEGKAEVRRFFSKFPEEDDEDTPAIRRKAPRNVSVIFMMFMPYVTCRDSRLRLSSRAKLDELVWRGHSCPRTPSQQTNVSSATNPGAPFLAFFARSGDFDVRRRSPVVRFFNRPAQQKSPAAAELVNSESLTTLSRQRKPANYALNINAQRASKASLIFIASSTL